MSNLKDLQARRESRTADRQKAMERLYNTYSGRKARERAEALEMDAFMAEEQERQRRELERQQNEGSKNWMNLAGLGAAAGTAFAPGIGTAIGGLAGAGLGIFAEASQKKDIAGQHGKKMGWGSALGKTVGRAPTMNEVVGLAGSGANIAMSMAQQKRQALQDERDRRKNMPMLMGGGGTGAGSFQYSDIAEQNRQMVPIDAAMDSDSAAAQYMRRMSNSKQSLSPAGGGIGALSPANGGSYSAAVQNAVQRPSSGGGYFDPVTNRWVQFPNQQGPF